MTEHKEVEPVAWKTVPRYEDADCYFDYTDSKDAAEKLVRRGWQCIPLGIIEPNTVNTPTADYKQLKADAERFNYLMDIVFLTIDRTAMKALVTFAYWGTKQEVIKAIDKARGKE